MENVENNPQLVAYCGLYCGACGKYRSGKCPGCAKNQKASWCGIRKCCMINNYKSCAECKQHDSIMECKKFNNMFSKIFALIFRSDRKACIDRIKEIGTEAFAREMAEKGLQSIKRK